MKIEVEWIKTSDRLPEHNQEILYYIPGIEDPEDRVGAGYYDADWGKFCAGIEGMFQDDPENVSHWMPFPKPPVQEED